MLPEALVLERRLYVDRHVKGAFVRRGFKQWVERGFPRDPATGRAPAELMKRGWDGFVRFSARIPPGWSAAFVTVQALTQYVGEFGG